MLLIYHLQTYFTFYKIPNMVVSFNKFKIPKKIVKSKFSIVFITEYTMKLKGGIKSEKIL